MNPTNVRLVAQRELQVRVMSRAFVVSTMVMIILVLAAITIPAIVGDDGRPTYSVGLVAEGEVPDEEVKTALAAVGDATGTTLEPEPVGDQAAAEAAIRDGSIDFAVLADGEVVVERPPDDDDSTFARVLASTAQTLALRADLADSGLSPEAIDEALQAEPVRVRSLEPGDPDNADERAVGFGAVFVLFIMLISYGGWITTAVVEEKSNRIIEVLLSTTRPADLLAGKVIGVGATGLFQLTLVAIPGLVATAAGGSDLPSTTAATILAVLAWAALGFALYGFLYAAAGSLCSRMEEAQSAALPITMLLMIGYFAGAIAEPSSTIVRVASFVPLWAPLAMLPRIATGDVAIWELAVSAVIMIAATVGVAAAASRIHRGAVLRSGRRFKLREAWAAAGR